MARLAGRAASDVHALVLLFIPVSFPQGSSPGIREHSKVTCCLVEHGSLWVLLHRATLSLQKERRTTARLPSDLVGFADLGLGSGHAAAFGRCGGKM